MNAEALRSAYRQLLDVAATDGLGEADDGGWNADQVLAHLISVDAAVAAVALQVISGSRPSFDNRVTLDSWNLGRIIAEHSDRAELIDHVRRQAAVLCEIAEQLSDDNASVLVPALMVSNGRLDVDQPIPLTALIDGLADDHIPRHAQQLRELERP
jgi:hypothetical protein